MQGEDGANSQDFPCGQAQHNVIFDMANHIIAEDQQCFYKPAANWDLTRLALFSAEWICNEGAKPAPDSRFWLYSSTHFEKLTSGLVDREIRVAAIVLVNTSAALYDWGHEDSFQDCSSSDLWRIRSIAGTQVLLGLEKALSDKTLAKASRDELKALILVLLGTTVAVGYLLPGMKVQTVWHPQMANVYSLLMSYKGFADAHANRGQVCRSPGTAFEISCQKNDTYCGGSLPLQWERNQTKTSRQSSPTLDQKSYERMEL